MDNGWIDLSEGPIAAGDEPIIVWHIYRGVMVYQREKAPKNRFVTHWREIDTGAWISIQERMPTAEDADVFNCVVSLDKWGDKSMAGWHRFRHESDLVAWQHPPQPPN